ncbi:probable aspartic proteinase GIP2 [Ricinus communis]|uniref:Basic 7S globulin 2 small subunit, putative n=1 Tax=Ricinus communis TaxID=3988 RepID=B9RTV2_RICCO|nr:probable aspartic proteinase GIP2 [Ricinus communis]EEF45334.1 basic 7S globulin 2 precursor small subunit, putative [Ricinus communis]|eukprot:XP_002517171.1 basic 7S globulin [Ricinus communis]
MGSLFHCFFSISFLLFLISPSTARAPFRPKALLLPVFKDKCTRQYITQIDQRTPLVPVKLTVDLGGSLMWINCEEGYVSSSYRPLSCDSALCSLSNSQSCNKECYSSPKPGCYNNTCGQSSNNRVVYIGTGGDLGQDVVALQSFDGKNLGRIVSVPNFPFVCGITWLLDDLADGVTGMAGLGRSNISLPAYFSSAIGFSKTFSICLSSSTKSNGVIVFGDGPSSIVSNDLIYIRLILNPVGTPGYSSLGESSADYYIGVKSIRVDGKEVKFDKTLLSIDKDGNGGTMLSTVNPYTVLHTSIYKALLKAFIKKLVFRFSLVVPSVPVPFGACVFSNGFRTTEEFLSYVPIINLELESEQGNSVYWRILGANSMVAVNSYTMCLAFIDGGSQPRTPIIIGGHQLEDNLLHFDLASSRLGFSSSLLPRNTTCSNLNFNAL